MPVLPLRTALETDDHSKLIKSIYRISLDKLERERKLIDSIKSELVSLRKSWAYVKENKLSGISEIEEKGKELKAKLEAIPAQYTLRDLEVQDGQLLSDNVQILLCWINDSLNIEALSEMQIEAATLIIIAQYGSLRLEDLALCFKNAISGKYGKIYQKIDITDLARWIEQYREDLRGRRVSENESFHQSTKSSHYDERHSNSVRAILHNHKTFNK